VGRHVIIGSGINALVAGAMLARKGEAVLVLEREDRIGGCMMTDAVTLPGFTHDVMAATFVLFLTSPAHAALGADLARHGMEFCHTPHPTAVLRPDGSTLVLTTDRAANVAAMDAAAPGDGGRHLGLVSGVEADAPFLFGLLGGDLWSWRTGKLMLSQARKRGVQGLAAWFGAALAPSRAVLERYEGATVQALFAPWILHTGLTPESAYGAKMTEVIAFALEAAGAPVVKGGAARAADAFRRLIEEKGGEVRTRADVTRITTAAGRVTGVELRGGERIAATSVLASVAPVALIALLGDAAPAPDREAAKTFRHGRGNFQLHYALDRAPEWIAAGLEKVALVHLADGIDSVSKSANEAERGMLPAVPTLCVGQPAALDPTRAPDGKATLWIQVPDAPCVVKGDSGGTITTTPEWTEPLREAFADRIEGILAAHIRDFAAIKLARRAYSPADLAAMNVNLVGGDPYGGQASLDQFFLWRPFKHSRNGTSAIRGLRHIGASTHPGAGLGGGSGYLAARALGA